MKPRLPKTLQATLISLVSLSVAGISLMATLLHLSILSNSLNYQLKDKALVLARIFDISIKSRQEIEDVEGLQQKILDLKASQPDINEIDIVVPVPTLANQFYLAATTNPRERGVEPNPLESQVIQTDTPLINLEIVDRKSGEDRDHFPGEQIGLREVIRSLFHRDQLYVWEVISPLHDNQNQVIGSIGIEISLDEVITQIQASLLKSLLVFLGSLAAIILAIWYCLRRIIIHPLQILTNGIQTVQTGNFSYKLEVKRPHELGQLAAAYNDMIASLQRSRAEIIELNRSLQDRVDQATSELQKINQALALKIEELEKTQQKLIRSERNAAAAMIAAGIAHEIKNPLSTIKLIIQHLQDKFISPDARKNPKYQEFYQIILEQIQQLDSLVMAFLDYTRPIKLHPVLCSLHELLDNTLALVMNGVTSTGIEVKKEYAENLPAVLVDPEMLKRAFVNLLLNAIQAMPDGGILTLKTEFIEKTQHLQITITDTGIGIEEIHLPKLFNPFFTTKANGIGLGLAIVQRAIQAHNGQISVISQVGKGTSFCIELGLQAIEGRDQTVE
jgi:signal transduction histidine kinase